MKKMVGISMKDMLQHVVGEINLKFFLYEGGICGSVDFKGTCFIKIRSRLKVIIHA